MPKMIWPMTDKIYFCKIKMRRPKPIHYMPMPSNSDFRMPYFCMNHDETKHAGEKLILNAMF